ncbi:MAG: MarR family transcriptional regulator [Candidatus Bathyarchaeia archaeon]
MSAKLKREALLLLREQPLTLKELAEKMGLKEKRAFRILRSLFEKGEITSFRGEDNQRRYGVSKPSV